MQPYTATISKKNTSIIEDKILTIISKTSDNHSIIWFLFPEYIESEYKGSMSLAGGNKYVYSIENNKLILKDQYSNIEIVFRKIE